MVKRVVGNIISAHNTMHQTAQRVFDFAGKGKEFWKRLTNWFSHIPNMDSGVSSWQFFGFRQWRVWSFLTTFSRLYISLRSSHFGDILLTVHDHVNGSLVYFDEGVISRDCFGGEI